MKDIIRGKGLMLKVFTRKFQDLESQVLNRAIIVSLGDMEVQKVTVQDMGYCQVLKEKCKISELSWLPSLDNHVHLCSCLGRPSHERHNSWQGSDVEILCPEKFQDLESQVLNSAVIVQTWGHGVAKNVHFKTWNTKS